MKKIAFITPSFYPSILTGSGIVVMKLAEEFVKLGYDVSVITSNALTPRFWYDPLFGRKIRKKSETFHGIKVHRLSCAHFYSSICFVLVRVFRRIIPKYIFNKLVIEATGPSLNGLGALIKSENYDVIHCSPSPLAINMQTVRLLKGLSQKPKFIFTPFFHSEVGNFTNPELKKVFDAADIIHVITNVEKVIIQDKFGISHKKIKVVPLFLDTEDMHDGSQLEKDVAVFKRKYRVEKKKIVLFAGIKGYAKGATNLLLAMSKIYKKNQQYILITIGTDTKEWIQTKKMVDNNCFLDLGYKVGKEKEIIFSASDIYCMPSKSESFGLVYLEAWHKKKPVIVASTPAVKEFIGKDGVFVAFDSKKQIEDAILSLSASKIAQKKFGKNGYNKLIKHYIFSSVFPKYQNMFLSNNLV